MNRPWDVEVAESDVCMNCEGAFQFVARDIALYEGFFKWEKRHG